VFPWWIPEELPLFGRGTEVVGRGECQVCSLTFPIKKTSVLAGNFPLKMFWPGMVAHLRIILVLASLRQEDFEFEASLGYRAKLCLRKRTNVLIFLKETFF
jgi:hypothetical protein